MKKRILVVLAVIVLLSVAYLSQNHFVQGNDRQLENLLENALTQDHLDAFFDTNRGKPELEWSGSTAYFKSGYLQSKKEISEDTYTFSLDVSAFSLLKILLIHLVFLRQIRLHL